MPTTPSGVQLFSQTDLELAVGGAAVLVQLLDKNGDGTADADLVTSVIGRASAYVISAVGSAVQISSLTAPYPDVLVFTAANVGAYYSWSLGSSEIVVPDGAKMLMDAADKTIEKIKNRDISLGQATPAASGLEVKAIDVDNGGINGRTTRTSLKGWW